MKFECGRGPYGKNGCWAANYGGHAFGSVLVGEVPRGREIVAGRRVLEPVAVNDPDRSRREFTLQPQWFAKSRWIFVGPGFCDSGKRTLYRCLDRVLEHSRTFSCSYATLERSFRCGIRFVAKRHDDTYVEGEVQTESKSQIRYNSRDKRNRNCKQV